MSQLPRRMPRGYVTLGTKDIEKYRGKVREIADFFGWDVGEEEVDLHLLTALLDGRIGQDTVYVEPGRTVTVDMLADQLIKVNDLFG